MDSLLAFYSRPQAGRYDAQFHANEYDEPRYPRLTQKNLNNIELRAFRRGAVPVLLHLLDYELRQLDEAVGVAPLVVVPGQHLHEVVVEHHRVLRVHGG